MRRLNAATALALLTTLWLVPARADISPTTFSAPYDGTDGWEGCDAPGGGECSGDADGDIATGRLLNSWAVASSDGGTTPGHAYGRASRSMWTEFTLDEPAGAVELTFRVHVDKASATTTNPAGGSAAAQLLLYGSGAGGACGGGCFVVLNEELVSTSGTALREDEDLVRTMRIVNLNGGNVPAGTFRASVELYGGAFIGDYQNSAAGSSELVTDLVWTSVDATVEPALPEPPPPPPASYVTVTRPYIGGDPLDGGMTCQYRTLAQPAVGGACIQVPHGAVAAQVSIGDLVNNPVGGTVGFGPLGFCGTSERVAVYPGQQELAVTVDAPGRLRCGPASFGTIGVVTATFEIRSQPHPTPLPG